jgi:hypothetical protein
VPILGVADLGIRRAPGQATLGGDGRMEWVHEADTVQPGLRPPESNGGQAERVVEGDHGETTERAGVLDEAEQRTAEQDRYRALVDRTYGQAQEQDEETGGSNAWARAVPELQSTWQMLKQKYAYHEQRGPTPQAEGGTDGGSWRGQGGRTLDADQNAEIDRGYSRIREVGENVIVPGVLRAAAEDPNCTLAGFDHRIKGLDRLKEKVADLLEPPSKLTAAGALSLIVDVVRFTCTHPEDRYTHGVLAGVERLKAQGFELDKLKNTWESEQYKGTNTQWLEPRSGVRFEVQFHTSASLEAKELTHGAYERIRSITEQTPETERESAELEAFQSEVNARIPIPLNVRAIEDYRREKRDG